MFSMLLLARALFLVLSGLPRGFRPLFSLFAGNRFRRGTRAFLARALRAIIRARHGGGALPNTILPNNISHGSRQQRTSIEKGVFNTGYRAGCSPNHHPGFMHRAPLWCIPPFTPKLHLSCFCLIGTIRNPFWVVLRMQSGIGKRP